MKPSTNIQTSSWEEETNAKIVECSHNQFASSKNGHLAFLSTTRTWYLVELSPYCAEQHVDLCAVFVDHTKAFDTVRRKTVWTSLAKLGCPRRFVKMVYLFHDDMTSLVFSVEPLASVISNDGSLDKKVITGFFGASQAIGLLRAQMLKQHSILQSTKLKVYTRQLFSPAGFMNVRL